jgi:sterol desaturase/sphingolipid hydroxylase (fatty acid hydroxylase superfamily)
LFLSVAVLAFGISPLACCLQPLVQLPISYSNTPTSGVPPRLDRALACVIVTPGMHLVHHSRVRPEHDSNYSTVLTIWDRFVRQLSACGATGSDRYRRFRTAARSDDVRDAGYAVSLIEGMQ